MNRLSKSMKLLALGLIVIGVVQTFALDGWEAIVVFIAGYALAIVLGSQLAYKEQKVVG